MTGWRIEVTRQFEKSLRALDTPDISRAKNFLEQLGSEDDPRSRGKPLTGNLSGFWRYRFGDFRILVEIRAEERTLVLVSVGHRSTIYRR